MKNLLTFVFMLCICSATFAAHSYYPCDLRDRLESGVIKNHALKNMLKELLTSGHLARDNQSDILVKSCQNRPNCYSQKTLDYQEARSYLFGRIHLKRDQQGYYVKDVYCNRVINKNVGPMKIPNHNEINCEHTWPKSRFSHRHSLESQKTDLHNLYPTDQKANAIRSSYHFGEVDSNESRELCAMAKLGSYKTLKRYNDRNKFFFDPPEEHRGNVARALFYFSVRYDLSISEEEEIYLRKWHEEDPVDEEERKRNETIYNIQHNRNPFIDYPELVSRISDF